MLQAIRSKAESFIVKLLFALLTATFALWGIGDIFRNWGSDTTVAKVGGKEIAADQLSQAVRSEVEQLRNVLHNDIDMEQAKQLGLVNSALQQMISAHLLEIETDRLGLAMGDEGVRQAIVENPDFKGPSGSFDRARYDQLLAANQLTEPQYEASVRENLLRSELTGALIDGVTPPASMVDALYRSRAEHRVATTVTLTPAAVPAPPAPTQEQLAAYHDAHKDAFRTPEQRSISIATLRLEDVAATIKVPEDKLKSEYEARRDEFHTPEERDVQQLLLPDQAKAKAAEAELQAGKDFAAVAKEQADADASTTDLGWVKRDDLPKDLAAAAFALAQGKPSEPIHTSFGWHILLITGIKPEAVQTFDQVKDRLAQEIARDEAGDQIAKTANNIDDATAAGNSFAAVAQKFGMKTETIASIDAQGHGADGKPVELPQPADTVLHTAFATDSGQTSPLTELGEDGYFLVHVDKIMPATVQPLSAVHDKAVSLWQADEKKNELKKLADQIVEEVKGGKSLKDVAAARKLTVVTTAPLQRTGGDPSVPPSLVAAIFGAKKGEAVSAAAGDNYAVAQVQSIEPADPAKDPQAVKQLSDVLGNAMRNDMLSSFDQALRAHIPVEINQANLDRLL
ncbi:MAG TPA: peptidyl-prolyl cis-trans isomerase [Stellaceae bacterium]|nr:peptidyl-prolyl cis-trans isomerase [Stellaceae bacterium]